MNAAFTSIVIAWVVLAATAPAGPRTPARHATPTVASRPRSVANLPWPEGTERLRLEDLDGVLMFEATARDTGGRDTTGWFVLDTGAGFLVLDSPLAIAMGVSAGPLHDSIAMAESPLPRFVMGGLTNDRVAPVLVFDAEIIRRVTDRPVLGLAGQKLFRDRALWLDFEAGTLALIPATAAGGAACSREDSSRRVVTGLLSSRAVPVPFQIAEDGKVLVSVRVAPRGGKPGRWLTLVMDTGATKCVLFSDSAAAVRKIAWGPSISGLVAPTLMGRSPARLVRAGRVEVTSPEVQTTTGAQGTMAPTEVRSTTLVRGKVPAFPPIPSATDVDFVLIDSPLGAELAKSIGQPVDGLLGYSFLRQFRVACDYPHRVLWLDPIPGFRDPRPFENSHVGIQLERVNGTAQVVAVADSSPAARAGIRVGDILTRIDGTAIGRGGVVDAGLALEGAPGSVVTLAIMREGHETTYRLKRRRLL